MDGFDLTKYQNDEDEQKKIAGIMGKMLSGRSDYEAVIEKRDEKVVKCECGWSIEAGAKFCQECGTKC
jgi:acetone carboxylase gamma subunit|tara:strand:+ start:77 stop:280 length:204 start_codon:yes stop_codon:yes gene_type:complete